MQLKVMKQTCELQSEEYYALSRVDKLFMFGYLYKRKSNADFLCHYKQKGNLLFRFVVWAIFDYMNEENKASMIKTQVRDTVNKNFDKYLKYYMFRIKEDSVYWSRERDHNLEELFKILASYKVKIYNADWIRIYSNRLLPMIWISAKRLQSAKTAHVIHLNAFGKNVKELYDQGYLF